MISKALITTVPFAAQNRLPLDLLEAAGVPFLINPKGRRLTEDELAEIVGDYDAIIAGTEPITGRVLAEGRRLKHISRVGVGLDNVDLLAAESRGIRVSYTPDAPGPAVAELTIGLMISLLRGLHVTNIRMHSRQWHRYLGRRIAEVTVGIIGVGRVGARVIRRLRGFGTPRILANDLKPDHQLDREFKIKWATKEEIYREADLISLHLPLTAQTRNLIDAAELKLMKPEALIVNTSRGGIVNETALAAVLSAGELGGAAIDVFEHEPYNGILSDIESCLLTAHMGSMSEDCRARMELEATEEVIRFLKGEPLKGLVAPEEYILRREQSRQI